VGIQDHDNRLVVSTIVALVLAALVSLRSRAARNGTLRRRAWVAALLFFVQLRALRAIVTLDDPLAVVLLGRSHRPLQNLALAGGGAMQPGDARVSDGFPSFGRLVTAGGPYLLLNFSRKFVGGRESDTGSQYERERGNQPPCQSRRVEQQASQHADHPIAHDFPAILSTVVVLKSHSWRALSTS
jgi:hypothetical protein